MGNAVSLPKDKLVAYEKGKELAGRYANCISAAINETKNTMGCAIGTDCFIKHEKVVAGIEREAKELGPMGSLGLILTLKGMVDSGRLQESPPLFSERHLSDLYAEIQNGYDKSRWFDRLGRGSKFNNELEKLVASGASLSDVAEALGENLKAPKGKFESADSRRNSGPSWLTPAEPKISQPPTTGSGISESKVIDEPNVLEARA